jgi:hypothetical protein
MVLFQSNSEVDQLPLISEGWILQFVFSWVSLSPPSSHLIPSSSLPSYVAFIEGFHLFDPDEGVAIVRADVNIPSTRYTFLSLNVDHLGTSLVFVSLPL